jgi:hypothetical protein
MMVLAREAEDDGDWRDAGCSSSAQWLAQITSSDYHTAKRITETGEALRNLPALDAAIGAGALTLDQVAAAAPFATPETDAELARIAVGKQPGQIASAARRLVPPKVVEDQELYERRALSMQWTKGRRELAINGRLPLELGVAFENAIWDVAKTRRAEDKKTGPVLGWQQYTADALLALTTRGTSTASAGEGVRRSATTVIVHLSADEPPFLEGAGTISPETADWLTCDARRLTIKPQGRDLVHSRVKRCASYAQLRALVKRSKHCQYPGCTSMRELQAHHMLDNAKNGASELDNFSLLCTRHHKHLHDNHITATGDAKNPTFTDENGRAITAMQPHAPPR